MRMPPTGESYRATAVMYMFSFSIIHLFYILIHIYVSASIAVLWASVAGANQSALTRLIAGARVVFPRTHQQMDNRLKRFVFTKRNFRSL